MTRYTMLVQGTIVSGTSELSTSEVLAADFITLQEARMGEVYHGTLLVRSRDVAVLSSEMEQGRNHLDQLQAALDRMKR